MSGIDAVRNLDNGPAIFLRFGRPGRVIIQNSGVEIEIERSVWIALPIWTAPLQQTDVTRPGSPDSMQKS